MAIEELLAPLVEGGFSTVTQQYDGQGVPVGRVRVDSTSPTGEPLIVLLAIDFARMDGNPIKVVKSELALLSSKIRRQPATGQAGA